MGLMNAIGLQPRHPAPSVTSQGTQTPVVQLQNAETQTERDLAAPSTSHTTPGEGHSHLQGEEPCPAGIHEGCSQAEDKQCCSVIIKDVFI